MDDRNQGDGGKVEYVGAPTEFAEAEEVPEWVATTAKVLFFVPAAFITATTIPIIVMTVLVVCSALCCVLIALL